MTTTLYYIGNILIPSGYNPVIEADKANLGPIEFTISMTEALSAEIMALCLSGDPLSIHVITDETLTFTGTVNDVQSRVGFSLVRLTDVAVTIIWNENPPYELPEATTASGTSIGTGSQQVFFHGLNRVPTRVSVWTTDEEIITISQSNATNIYITVPNGISYTWLAEL